MSSTDDAALRAFLERLNRAGPGLARYRVVETVARGGMGEVHRVRDEHLQRDLAMKVALERPAGEGAARERREFARFVEEARLTARLDHPGIVPVHEVGVDDGGRVFFTMRFVEGRNLREIIDLARAGDEGWNQARVLWLLLRVCDALAYAHAKGIVHRDVKPDNVMVGRFGETYLMDWGLAHALGTQDAGALETLDGDIVGTPGYMAPEQAEGRLAEMGPHADVYSVGAMLYHLLTGRMPYHAPDSAASAHAILQRLLRGPPRRVRSIDPSAPAELVAICEKAMARAVADRYATIEAFAEDLRAYLEHRVVRAFHTGAWQRTRKWIERNPAITASVIAFMLLTAMFVVRLQQKTNVAFANERRATANELRAQRASAEADARAREVEHAWREARAERDRVLRLADAKRLQDLQHEMAALWPAVPERAAEMRHWLERAKALLDRREEHRRTLASMRKWSVEDDETAWWFATLEDLVLRLDAFAEDDPHGDTVASMERRAAFAESVARVTLEEAHAAWDEAARSIADAGACPRYGGLAIAPQLGLVPLWRDPHSGLWEFWHVQSGERPRRDGTDRVLVTGETGVVLVLVPGGRFRMGAQADDPGAPNHAPGCQPEEGPVHEVTLTPFFMAKHEMTQGQWLRFTGENPSTYPPGQHFGGKWIDLAHPVEHVSWTRAQAVLERMGLTLPTEAQWEYGARGGTSTPWWTGSEVAGLDAAGNLVDRFCRDHGGPTTWNYEDQLDDGFVLHAPAGSFAPNPYGLHDTIGNVWEWCRDWSTSYVRPAAEGDGTREPGDGPRRVRVFRGGCFSDRAWFARSSNRSGHGPDYRYESVGLRAARPLER